MKNKLQTKDFISAGVFAAMYIIMLILTVTITGIIPILYLFAPLIVGIVCGTVYMLYVMKVQKSGAVLILSILLGYVLSSHSWVSLVWSVLCGVVAEIILKQSNHASIKGMITSYSAFACSTVGPFLTILFAKASFMESTATYYGEAYAATLDALTPPWIIIVLIVLGIIGGIIGGNIGNKMLKKHFLKAGIV